MEWFDAVESGDIATLERMIKEGENVDRKSEKYEITALMMAVYDNDKEVVKLLLQAGADPNLQTDDKDTAIMFPSSQDDAEVMELLLQAGADPNMQNFNGDYSLIFAARDDRVNTLKVLLQSGVRLNLQNKYGNTPLMSSIINNHKKSAELLLQAGADPNIANNRGETPLNRARSEEMLQLLFDAGADPFVRDSSPKFYKLFNEARWKRLYARDVDTARRYSQSTSLPKDVWQLILLNKHQQQLCENLRSAKNKGILKYFALELNIPITEDMTKARLCALISRQLAYGYVYGGQPEQDIENIRAQVQQTAFKFGLNPELSTRELLKQLSAIFK